jgi:hypothetical protein
MVLYGMISCVIGGVDSDLQIGIKNSANTYGRQIITAEKFANGQLTSRQNNCGRKNMQAPRLVRSRASGCTLSLSFGGSVSD